MSAEPLVVELVDRWHGNAVIEHATIIKATTHFYVAADGRKWRRTETRAWRWGGSERLAWPGNSCGRPAPIGDLTPETCIALERHFGTPESVDAMEAMFCRGRWAEIKAAADRRVLR